MKFAIRCTICTFLTYFPSQSKNCCLHVNHWERRGKNSLRPHATLCFQTFDFINVCVQHTCTLWCVGWVALQSYISQSTTNTWKRLLIKYIWEDKNGLVSSRLAKGGFFPESAIRFFKSPNLPKKYIPKNYPELEI